MRLGLHLSRMYRPIVAVNLVDVVPMWAVARPVEVRERRDRLAEDALRVGERVRRVLERNLAAALRHLEHLLDGARLAVVAHLGLKVMQVVDRLQEVNVNVAVLVGGRLMALLDLV